ncbi:MAG: DUF2157 domain-containing protein [Betaproteobacteria bacterium]|nr:MAG: DUF2157 domain-containing protein [Betaproteobacteria bacterium]
MQNSSQVDAEISDDDLRALAGGGTLNAVSLARARQIVGVTPNETQWHRFLHRLAITGGAAVMSSALICFVAYNWTALGRWFRFGLLEGLIVLAVGIAIITVKRPMISRAAGLIAFFALGGLLAFTGQTYQTGADTWQLFAGWAALGLLWVLAARWWGLWLVWFLVAEVGLNIWAFGDARLGRWLSRYDEPAMFMCLANAAAFAAFFWARRFTSLNVPWVWRTAAAFTIFWATVAGSISVWGERIDAAAVAQFLIGGAVLAMMWWWSSRPGSAQFEPWVLYLVAFGGIAMSAHWFARLIATISWELGALVAVYIIGAAVFSHNIIRKKTQAHRGEKSASDRSAEGAQP